MQSSWASRIGQDGVRLGVDQLLSGASNALSITLAAALLPEADFHSFALAQLLLLSALAGQRAFLLEPFLSFADGPRVLPVHWFSGALLLAGVLIPVLIATTDLSGGPVGPLILLYMVSVCALLQDFLRFAAIGQGRLLILILADGLWLAGAAVAFLLARPSTVSEAYLLWAGSAALSLLALWTVISTGSCGPSLRQVLGRGRFQLGEFVLITSSSLLPFMAARIFFPGSPIGAYRLVQSFIGPINSMATMMNLTLLSRAERLQSDFRVAAAAKRISSRIGRAITLLTLGYVVALGAAGALFVSAAGTGPIATSDLWLAFFAVGVATVVGASVSVKASILRVLGKQRYTLAPRAITLMFLSLGLLLGWALSGISFLDPLALSFIAGAVGSNVAWRIAFSRQMQTRSSSQAPH